MPSSRIKAELVSVRSLAAPGCHAEITQRGWPRARSSSRRSSRRSIREFRCRLCLMAGCLARGSSRSSSAAAGQGAVELVAGGDVELGEDLVEVVLDGAGAHEQLGGDLGVGQAVGGQPGDLGLPAGEPEGGLAGALADVLAGG